MTIILSLYSYMSAYVLTPFLSQAVLLPPATILYNPSSFCGTGLVAGCLFDDMSSPSPILLFLSTLRRMRRVVRAYAHSAFVPTDTRRSATEHRMTVSDVLTATATLPTFVIPDAVLTNGSDEPLNAGCFMIGIVGTVHSANIDVAGVTRPIRQRVGTAYPVDATLGNCSLTFGERDAYVVM